MMKLNWLRIVFPAFHWSSGFPIAVLLASLATASAAEPSRERISFNDNWLFTKGEPTNTTDSLAYAKVKQWINMSGADLTTNTFEKPEGAFPAEAPFAQPGSDDREWRKLNVPHDWAIEGPFEQRLEGSTGKLKFSGPVWYRKHFEIPKTDSGRKIFLD